MKTVGKYLKDQRLKAELDLDTLAEKTKIRKDFLEAIEQDQFGQLPSAAFVKGFIRSYALAVDIDPEKVLAIFRRDYDQNKQGKVIPRGLSQPIATKNHFWTPRTTSLLILAAFLFLVGLYVLNQLKTLISPPTIVVTQPENNQIIMTNDVMVAGKTHTDAVLKVNNQLVTLDSDGQFEVTLNLAAGEHTILIEAETREGKTSQVTRTITVDSL